MKLLRGPRQRVYDIAFSPDGHFLVTCAADAAVRLWDTETGEGRVLVQAPIVPFSESDFRRVAFVSDGRHVLARSTTEGLQVWAVSENRRAAVLLPRPNAAYDGGLAVSRQSNCVAANEVIPHPFSTVIRLWDQATWQGRILPQTTENWTSAALAFDPTGSRLATNCGTFDIETGAQILAVPFSGARLEWSPDGRFIAGCGYTNAVWIYDAGTGELARLLRLERKHVQGFAFSPDGAHLAVVSNEEIVRVWETRTWSEREGFAWKIGKLKCIAFAPDGQRAACASDRGAILIWDWDL